MAKQAVAVRGVSIALACRAFGISQRCYRYAPVLSDENEEIEDWLIALTNAYYTTLVITGGISNHGETAAFWSDLSSLRI